ncbi:MAG: TonB-dependent receptor [Dysgonamonadaceae bacterium]|jgi:TonB-linked SusC/RagA family outer membrane protein|nr:TonB-dependent receptor [Dysgonamonadaceae bacterium]
MKKYLILILLTVISLAVNAQQKSVSGRVISAENSEPLAGVSVVIKNNPSVGTSTDLSGNFRISASPADVLLFSYLGYSTKEQAVGAQTVFDIVLESDLKSLDEIVVVGYGVAKKSDLTSSISSIKGDALSSMTVGNVTQSLQGKVAGVQVVAGSGAPGSTPKVLIRGFSSLNLSTDPLYVVDGVPMGTNVNFLNPNEIESMEVLKDASASAIYGSLASNGVIMVTTKRGIEGKPVFNAELTYGIQTMKSPYQMTNAQNYVKYMNSAFVNGGLTELFNASEYASAPTTDWWGNTVNSSSPQMNAGISVQGGSQAYRYAASVNWYQQDDFYKNGGDGWKKFTARISTDFKFSKYVSAGLMFNPRRETWGSPSNWQDALRIDPLTPIYKPESELTGDENEYSIYGRSDLSYVWNPVAADKRFYNKSGYYALGGNAYLDINPVAELTFRTLIGYDIKAQEGDVFEPDFSIDAAHEYQELNKVSRNQDIYTSYSWQNTLTWLKSFGRNNLTAMLGMTMDRSISKTLSGSSQKLPNNSEILREIDAGTMNPQVSGTLATSSLLSYFGRAAYNFDRRYYLTATYRRDGSSKFMANNKWAVFPSASAAWQITNEDFMKNQDVFSSLRLRAGWGRVGNQNLPSGVYESLIGQSYYAAPSNQYVNTTYISTLKNEDIKWETVEDINLGLDFALWNNRFSGSVEYYVKNTRDMLFQKPFPYYSGFPSDALIWANVGSMQSKGFEFLLNYRNSAGKFNYDISLTFTTFDVTTTELADGAKIVYGNSEKTKTVEGDEPAYYYGYVADGIFQNQTEINAHTCEHGNFLQPKARPGDIRFLDINGDGVLDGNDRTKIGSPWADFTAGLNISLSYSGVDLLANFYASYGNDLVNGVKNELHNGTTGQGLVADINEIAWHGEGTSNDIPILSRVDNNENYIKFSSFYVEDGSFLRLKNLQLGYTLPKKALAPLGVQKLRLYVAAQNLLTLTKFQGIEPEVAGDILSFGFSGWNYPVQKTFLAGINLTF